VFSLHEEVNSEDLIKPDATAVCECRNAGKCDSLIFTMTGPNHAGSDVLRLSSFEVFGLLFHPRGIEVPYQPTPQ
jgi:hypothetical protein